MSAPPPLLLTGETLRKWRKRRGLRGPELARRLSVNPAELAAVEAGRRRTRLGIALRLVAEVAPESAGVRPIDRAARQPEAAAVAPRAESPFRDGLFEAESYGKLRGAAEAAVQRGDLRRALDLFAEASELASRSADPELRDRAYCNWAAVAVALDDPLGPVPRLREILMAARSPETGFLAAYNVGRAYEYAERFDKGLFYARIARDRAEQVGHLGWQASSRNLMGNHLLALSDLDAAAREYGLALDLGRDQGAGLREALTLQNLGYCRLLQGSWRTGMALLYGSLRRQRRLGSRRALVHLDLCFAHQELGRWRDAWRHGRAAMVIAKDGGSEGEREKALYLLGAAASRLEEVDEARDLFSELQLRFPDIPDLPALLVRFDPRPVINLRA